MTGIKAGRAALTVALLALAACGGEKRSAAEQAELDTALIAAAWKNDVVEARRLIDAGANVNAKDDSVQSAYLVTTSEGYLELLELTLEHGADVKPR